MKQYKMIIYSVFAFCLMSFGTVVVRAEGTDTDLPEESEEQVSAESVEEQNPEIVTEEVTVTDETEEETGTEDSVDETGKEISTEDSVNVTAEATNEEDYVEETSETADVEEYVEEATAAGTEPETETVADLSADEVSPPETEETPAVEEAQTELSGFVTVDNQVRFFDPETNAPVTGEMVIDGFTYYFDDETGDMVTGWKTDSESNETAYYDESGHRLYGLQTINGKNYYFDPDSGVLQKNQKKLDGYYYYFDDETGAMTTGWKEIPDQGKTVYYNTEGRMVYGFQDIDDSRYYFNLRTGGMEKSQEKINGHYYYFDDETGKMVTGWKYYTDKDRTVYYNTEGCMVYGFQDIDDSRYYFNLRTGGMEKNQEKINGYYYYFDDETGKMVTGWKEIPDLRKTVYYNMEGRMVYGFQDIDDSRYYFNLRTGGMEKSQEKINGYYYYFDDETGKMVTGWKYFPDKDRTVYYNTEGRMVHGFQTVDNVRYYFDGSTGALTKKQRKIGGYYYYFDDETGEMVTGWKDIPEQNKRVYYNQSGRMVYGVQKIGDAKYFFNLKTGALSKNQQYDGKYWYYFDDETYQMITGWKDIPYQKKRVYYDPNGHMVYGNYTIDKILYVFEYGSGALIGNFKDTANGKQFVLKDGTLASGQKKINNNYYYFDEKTKLMVTGFKTIKAQNKTVFYDSDGIMKHKDFWYDGRFYLVSERTGAIKKGPSDGIHYYSQLDPDWASRYYGRWMFAGSGCGVSSIAMALTSINDRSIDPIDVANYLYGIGEYNNSDYGIAGSTGSANPRAASHWDTECDHITSYSELKDYLQGGTVVLAIVGPGDFCPSGVTHEILLYGYSDGETRVYDPLGNRASGWHSLSDVWDQQSTHWLDTDAGTPFFAFYSYE